MWSLFMGYICMHMNILKFIFSTKSMLNHFTLGNLLKYLLLVFFHSLKVMVLGRLLFGFVTVFHIVEFEEIL